MNADNTGTIRPKYQSDITLAEAIEENGQSRIYLGVHWQFDAKGGNQVGTAIANKVCEAFK